MLTVTKLLSGDIIWNKEMVQIKYQDNEQTILSEIKRLEFQYEAIDYEYIVEGIEPMYDEKTKRPYLLITCSGN